MWKTWGYSPAQLCKLPWVACILSVFLFLTCDISRPKSWLKAIISFVGMWMWHVVKLIPSSVCSTSPWKINIPDMTSSFLITAPAITGCRREAASRRCQTHLDSSCFLDVGFRWNVLFIQNSPIMTHVSCIFITAHLFARLGALLHQIWYLNLDYFNFTEFGMILVPGRKTASDYIPFPLMTPSPIWYKAEPEQQKLLK